MHRLRRSAWLGARPEPSRGSVTGPRPLGEGTEAEEEITLEQALNAVGQLPHGTPETAEAVQAVLEKLESIPQADVPGYAINAIVGQYPPRSEPSTLLHLVSGLPDASACKMLVQRGADVEACDWDGMTSLMAAAAIGNVAVLECLLDAGAKLDSTDPRGQTALSAAAFWGRSAAVDFLLERGADAHSKDCAGDTACVRAARVQRSAYDLKSVAKSPDSGSQSDVDAVFLTLMKNYIDSPAAPMDVDGNTILHMSVISNCKEAVEQALANTQDVDVRNAFGCTPLMVAAQYARIEAVEMLLGAGAELEARDRQGNTVLSWAAFNGNKELVEYLIDKDADHSVRNKHGETPLIRAAWRGAIAAVELLQKAGADIRAQDADGASGLMLACDTQSRSTVSPLINFDSDVHAADARGWTAMHYAAKACNRWTALSLLEESDASVNVAAKDGLTPLMMVAARHDAAMARTLMGAGADPSAKDSAGQAALDYARKDEVKAAIEEYSTPQARKNVPLCLAIRRGDVPAMRELLADGADADCKDANGSSMLGNAAYKGYIDALSTLLEAGADPTEGVPPAEDGEKKPKESECLNRAMGGQHGADEECAMALLEAGAHTDENTLINAAEKGLCAVVTHLIEKKGADVNAADINSRSPLSAAARQSKTDVVKLLLKHDIEKLHLHLALVGAIAGPWNANQGSAEITKLLLDAGAPTEFDRNGQPSKVSIDSAKGDDVVAVLKEHGL